MNTQARARLVFMCLLMLPNSQILTLGFLIIGDVKAPSKPIDVLAVMFDLEGFTNFARQVDPQLTVPSFLSDFLEWLFTAIKNQLIISKSTAKHNKLTIDEGKGILWAELPFFSKFMGDGVLFLW